MDDQGTAASSEVTNPELRPTSVFLITFVGIFAAISPIWVTDSNPIVWAGMAIVCLAVSVFLGTFFFLLALMQWRNQRCPPEESDRRKHWGNRELVGSVVNIFRAWHGTDCRRRKVVGQVSGESDGE